MWIDSENYSHANKDLSQNSTNGTSSIERLNSALLNSRKVCVVTEPVVAIINNKVEALQKKALML